MSNDSIIRSVSEEDGVVALTYRTARDTAAPAGPAWTIDELTLKELESLTGYADGQAPLAHFDSRSAAILCNGWQSWSASRELLPDERIHRARFIPKLNIYTDRPGLPVERRTIVSHFLTYLRNNDDYLVLVSRNAGSPPVSFRVDRADGGRVQILLYAEGQSFRSGEPVADIRLIRRSGFFAVRDALKKVFAGFDLFSCLSFLGAPGAPRLVPGGYESWYNHYADIDEGLILADLDGLSSSPNLVKRYYLDRHKPTVFQVDDGWETEVGDWSVNQKRFPRGLEPISKAISEQGLIPGLWFAPFIVAKNAPIVAERPEWLLRSANGSPVVAGWMPNWGGDFHCLDLSRPEVQSYVEGLVRRAVDEWGFRYIKLDFLYAGMLPGTHASGGPAWRGYEETLRRITAIKRSPSGQPVAFLGCGAPLENSFRYLPLMRIGADTKEDWDPFPHRLLRHQGRPSALMSLVDTVGRCLLDGAVFMNDPDVVFCRTANMALTRTEKEAVASGAVLLASQIMFSDDAAAFDSREEAAFTDWLIDFLDATAGREFGVRRLESTGTRRSPLAFRIFSRDGIMHGILNLDDSPVTADGPWNHGAVALLDRRGADGAFVSRSASLFSENQ
ncbi:MAG: alpha-galactosidase [Spirochaetales bacterium]|nr:MAG: alpha-galactosidase [Spirochaetales bacterium]